MPALHQEEFDPKAHTAAIKRARGAACYGALALHFGTASPQLLEKRVDKRERYDEDGGKATSNKYQHWRRGRALPSDDTAEYIEQRSGNAVCLKHWRDLPLWKLLAKESPSIPQLHRIIEASASVRHVLFLDGLPERHGFNHSPLERSQALALRNIRSLDAFTALLALARKGEQLEDVPQQHLPSMCAFDILPYVLHNNAALRYQWEGLFGCIHRIFWNSVYVTGAMYTFPIDIVQDRLAALDSDPTKPLPELAGPRRRGEEQEFEP